MKNHSFFGTGCYSNSHQIAIFSLKISPFLSLIFIYTFLECQIIHIWSINFENMSTTTQLSRGLLYSRFSLVHRSWSDLVLCPLWLWKSGRLRFALNLCVDWKCARILLRATHHMYAVVAWYFGKPRTIEANSNKYKQHCAKLILFS